MLNRRPALVLAAPLAAAVFIAALGTQANAMPGTTPSWYITTLSPSIKTAEGCAVGRSGIGGVVILDFGEMWFQNGGWGTIDFANNFDSIGAIETAVRHYVHGFLSCRHAGQTLQVAIGTSNYSQTYTTGAAGAAWGKMIAQLDNGFVQKGVGSEVLAAGADDIEPSWGGPNSRVNARAFVDAFNANSTYAGGAGLMYNYGSADGCPPYGGCANGWTQSDIWYVSGGAGAANLALPEIYYDLNIGGVNIAEQWYLISEYGVQHTGIPADIRGPLTEYSSGNGTLTPAQAYADLAAALAQDRRTQTPLTYSTNILF
jgi:hypothetical protein